MATDARLQAALLAPALPITSSLAAMVGPMRRTTCAAFASIITTSAVEVDGEARQAATLTDGRYPPGAG